MESTNTFYPVFEPDQVLTSAHLNQLRKYLATQDRLSRRLLHGVGVVCGLQISNPETNVITISKGVGITSNGFLLELADSDCEFFRPYEDKTYNEVTCEGQVEGKYKLFLKEDGTQINLWELLTKDEEAEIDDNRIKPLSEATMNLSDMYILLYLEIEDLDMMACFGEDCDEKGIQRNFKARKLLISKTDLLGIIEKTGKHGKNDTEAELEEAINAKYKLKPVSLKRLGYDYQTDVKTLSLSEYYTPDTLFQNYSSIIAQGAVDVGKSLHGAYEAYAEVLGDMYSENPFKNFELDDPKSNALYMAVHTALVGNQYSLQYAYDFLNDLVSAYDEFRKTAFELVGVCCPECSWFPRHLMLGKAIQPEIQPSIFRHYFIPSPIMNVQKELHQQVRLYFNRLVKLVEELNLALEEYQDIKVTPSANFNQPISERAIPIYYNVNDANQLYRHWSFDKASKHQHDTVLSYHAGQYNLSDLFVREPSFWEYKQYDFLRIEGHVGKKYEDVLSNVMSLRERLNLPIKVVGVKLSRRFQNTNVDVECRFDDLENLFRMFVTELRCILIEEREFFRSLDTDLSVGQSQQVLELLGDEPDEKAKTSGSQEILNLLRNQPEKKKSTSDFAKEETVNLSSGLRINTNIGTEGEQIGKGGLHQMSLDNTIGYLMDNVALSEGQDIYTSILNIYATGQFNYLIPGIFIYVILYPVQIAQNIDTLLENLPKSLEDLDLEVLNKDYNALIESANSFKNTIQTNLADPNYTRVGNEEVILYRLDKLIYHCSISKLIELYKIYQKRIEEVKQLNLFARFAKDHPGMEHMAGVPKGGTFVIVYADKNEKAAEFKPHDALQVLTQNTGFLRTGVDLQKMRESGSAPLSDNPRPLSDSLKKGSSAKSKNILANTDNPGGTHLLSNQNMLSAGWDQLSYLNQLQQLEREGLWGQLEPRDDLPPDNVVIADFALPYLCCGSCQEIATMVVSQMVFRLEKSEFCKDDEKSYKFMTDPSGGKVTGQGVTSQGADYFFTPALVDQAEENIQFKYEINNQTLVFNAKLYNPKADFEPGEPIVMNDGTVRMKFFNKSKGADRYVWEFGDGGKSEEFEPEHIYQLDSGREFMVTLTAKRGECENVIAKEIVIPVFEEIVFEIEPVKFCFYDENLYQFTAEPAGGIVTGPGVVNEEGTWYFKPTGIKMWLSEDIEFRYTLPDGRAERLFVKVFNPIANFEFTLHDWDPKVEGFPCTFRNKSKNAGIWLWDFGDGSETSTEENPVHVYRYGEDNNITYTASLKAQRDKCEDTFQTIIILPTYNFPTFGIGGKGKVCNSSQELIPFTTDPPATEDNPVTGPGVVFSNGKYYFNPFGVSPGMQTFHYMGETATIEVLDSPPSEFGYQIVEQGDNVALVQFNYNAPPLKSITWDFGDGGNSNKTNPRHQYKDIDFPATFEVAVVAEAENGCTTQFMQVIILEMEGQASPEVDLSIQPLKRFAKNELSVQVFGEKNTLPNSMINYFTEVQTELKDPAMASDYVKGKRNDTVAKTVDGFSQNIYNKIKKLKKSDPNLISKQNLAYKFYHVNMNNLLELMILLSKDLKATDAMMGSLEQFAKQLEGLIEMGVQVNPGNKVKKDLADRRAKLSGKPVIIQGINEIADML